MLEISKDDIISRLEFDNPWWEEGREGKVAFEETLRRKYFHPFHQKVVDTSVRRAVVLMGPRRVGKTVMVYHSIRDLLDSDIDAKNILYLSLETPVYTGLPLERILRYFQELFGHKRDAKLFVFFDEIQYLRNWEVHLKSLVDSFANYRFIATGSAAAALRLKSNESGAGRFTDYILPPLTFAEYLMFIGREDELIKRISDYEFIKLTKIKFEDEDYEYPVQNIDILNEEFVNYLNFGGYPEAVFSETIRKDPSQYIKSDIIDKVLLRDLPSLYGISDIQELNRLFTTLAYNSGNEISLDALSQSSGVVKNTIRRYLEYLEAAFLIQRVERIDQNAKRFKRANSFKVYLTNPSMRSALFGKINADSDAMGAMTETAIFSQWQHNKLRNYDRLYYARWKKGEIDIVGLDLFTAFPEWTAEIKWSDRPYTIHSELDNCVEFVNKNQTIKPPIIVTTRTVHDPNVKYKGVWFTFTPSSFYTYLVGANRLHILIDS